MWISCEYQEHILFDMYNFFMHPSAVHASSVSSTSKTKRGGLSIPTIVESSRTCKVLLLPQDISYLAV